MQTTIPMPELKHKIEAVYYWLDRVQPGRIFTAREVMGAIHSWVVARKLEERI